MQKDYGDSLIEGGDTRNRRQIPPNGEADQLCECDDKPLVGERPGLTIVHAPNGNNISSVCRAGSGVCHDGNKNMSERGGCQWLLSTAVTFRAF